MEHPRSLLCQLKYSYLRKKAIANFSFFKFLIILSLAYRSEQLHLLLYGSLDRIGSGS